MAGEALKIKPPRNFKNPGAKDWREQLFAKRIKASAYVQAKGHNILLSQNKTHLQINVLRERVSSYILHHIQKSTRGLIAALAL